MIDLSTNDVPLADAVRAMGDRTPVGSLLSSAEWAQMPLALRQRAQFSAKIESMRVLDRVQQRLMETVRETRRQLDGGGEGSVNTRQNFINELRQIAMDEGLRSPDGKQRTVQDPTSVARMGLIWDQQTGQTYGYAGWKNGQDAALLDAYPAQELVRVSRRKIPRNWVARWRSAGGRVFDGGRLIALKTDPIWETISRFGSPWPPFDFGSGMGVIDVGRRAAEILGLLTPGQPVKPSDLAFNDRLQAQARLIQKDADWKDWLETAFGDQVKIEGDIIKWTGGRTPLGDTTSLLPPLPAARREDLQRANALLDEVLRIPAGAEMDRFTSVGDDVPNPEARGRYVGDPEAPRIDVRGSLDPGQAMLSYLHETAHHIDDMLLGARTGTAGLASVTDAGLIPVWEAVAQSRLWETLDTYAARGPVEADYAGYLRQVDETFARALSQYVAERSGNPAALRAVGGRVASDPQTQGGQWSPADFAPIRAALDLYLRQKGWLIE